MTFQEFQNLEIGTKLRLRGTNAYFELADFDYNDNEVPLSVCLIETDKPVFVSYDTDWNQKRNHRDRCKRRGLLQARILDLC